MKKNRIINLLILGIFLIGIVNAANYCCERTTGGAWCQNVESESQCSTTGSYRVIASFCDATSYCKLGTCVNTAEGTCMSNTPQIVCEEEGGYWSEKDEKDLPQCQLGCCLIGDQAAFVTQISCNRLSSLYDQEIDWRSDITTEISCLENANPSEKGACVYTSNYVVTCEFTTREDCLGKKTSQSGVEFHEGYLCSAEELGADCAKSQQTRCEGDDVYFVDTCGNLANIYDSSKANDENYWTYIQEPTCSDGNGNKNSGSCGDCDYYSGSMCKEKEAGDSIDVGNYMCKDLDCRNYKGEYSGSGYPKHGESWCATDNPVQGLNENLPGSSYFRLICYNGEVTVEECDSTRQKICAEKVMDGASGFLASNCKINVWEDCTLQNNSQDCLDCNVRDCMWYSGGYFTDEGVSEADCTYQVVDEGLFGLFGSNKTCTPEDICELNENEDGCVLKDGREEIGMCVPKYAPGFERDGSEDTAGSEYCSLANSICYITYEKSLLPGSQWECVENCNCLTSGWAEERNQICITLGDCGVKKNFVGTFGKEFKTVKKVSADKLEQDEE